ncbi:MAG: hypothetical protein ACTSU8_05735 [Alphaproteobacteria bacterium]
MVGVMAYEAPEAGAGVALATAPILGAVKVADGDKPKTNADGDDAATDGDGDGAEASTDGDGDDAATDGDGDDAATDGDGDDAGGDGDGDGAEASTGPGGILGMAQKILGFGGKKEKTSTEGEQAGAPDDLAAMTEKYTAAQAKIETLEAEALILTEKANAGEELAKAVATLEAEKKTSTKRAAEIAKANFTPGADTPAIADSASTGLDYESQIADLHGVEKSAFIRENLAEINQLVRQEVSSTSRVDPSKFAGYGSDN